MCAERRPSSFVQANTKILKGSTKVSEVEEINVKRKDTQYKQFKDSELPMQ